MGLKRREEGTTESELWYRIRNQARKALLDLELLCEIASDEQLKEIFEPFTSRDNVKLDVKFGAKKLEDVKEMYPDIRPVYDRTDLTRILRVLVMNDKAEPKDKKLTDKEKSEKEESEIWRLRLASEMINIGLNYFVGKEEFQTRLHSRLFDDVRDAIGRYKISPVMY